LATHEGILRCQHTLGLLFFFFSPLCPGLCRREWSCGDVVYWLWYLLWINGKSQGFKRQFRKGCGAVRLGTIKTLYRISGDHGKPTCGRRVLLSQSRAERLQRWGGCCRCFVGVKRPLNVKH